MGKRTKRADLPVCFFLNLILNVWWGGYMGGERVPLVVMGLGVVMFSPHIVLFVVFGVVSPIFIPLTANYLTRDSLLILCSLAPF